MTSYYLRKREPQTPLFALLTKMRPDLWSAKGPIQGPHLEGRRKAAFSIKAKPKRNRQ